MTTLPYCVLCGNEKARNVKRIGMRCKKLIYGSLYRPYSYWYEAERRFKMCCGGIDSFKSGLFFHSEEFDCSYPEDSSNKDFQVCVECGINFYKEGAEAYYIFDNDTYCDSRVFSNFVPYTKRKQPKFDEQFWEGIQKELEKGAEAAWNDDILTCQHCGYHYHNSEPCQCQEPWGEEK